MPKQRTHYFSRRTAALDRPRVRNSVALRNSVKTRICDRPTLQQHSCTRAYRSGFNCRIFSEPLVATSLFEENAAKLALPRRVDCKFLLAILIPSTNPVSNPNSRLVAKCYLLEPSPTPTAVSLDILPIFVLDEDARHMRWRFEKGRLVRFVLLCHGISSVQQL